MVNENEERHRRHFVLEGVTETEAFRSRGGGVQPQVRPRDRTQHGRILKRQIDSLRADTSFARNAQQAAGLEDGLGLQIEFASFPNVELAFERLDNKKQDIELLNVRHENFCTYATVFVPDGKLNHFENLLRDYLERRRDRIGRVRDNQRLINAIREIRLASIRALWTDTEEAFPEDDKGLLWFEVWLPVRRNRRLVVDSFRRLAGLQGMEIAPGELRFPERTVLLIRTSMEKMQDSILVLNSIAELRRAKETADFFDSLPAEQQHEWLDDLLSRTRFPSDDSDVPHVCLLDTGVNRGHRFLEPALATDDLHTVEPAWGTDDTYGHGTQMAGLALAGNLTPLLVGSNHVQIDHRLESVKLLQQSNGGGTDARHHGFLTMEAVSRPEIIAPLRPRVFGMAITTRDNRDRGRPSSWSAALDSLAADVVGDGAHPRLLIVSAGNIKDLNAMSEYPDSNDSDGLHDPAQAWNALTVGAYTDLANPDAQEYEPIAQAGGLSPFSTTSLTWQSQWPLKPDVVLEGGNAAKDARGPTAMSSLSLLTTHHHPADRLLTTINATSAATALAARFAARVMAVYPDLWPETIRALIVHSAKWTSTMEQMFLPSTRNRSKADYQKLLRRCGFGVPDLDHALWSVSNSLVMVVQETLHPFKKEAGKQPTTRDMHLHKLPWPVDILEELGEMQVEMRVTLSYFVEPNPSQRSVSSRYRYESHGLRFDVKRPAESIEKFRARINVVARDEEDESPGSRADSAWLIGTQNRHRGSLHGDIWYGSAADLASRGYIGVYPASGWWRTRHALGRYDREARYALVISIKAPETDIDLYAEVENQIGIPVVI